MRRVAWLARGGSAILCACLAVAAPAPSAAPSARTFAITPVAELRLTTLPDGPLYWRVERFPTIVTARRSASATALFVRHDRQVWRFTLGSRPDTSPRGALIATIGPVPKPRAAAYLLRINRAGGPPGVATPVHTHPGSEAFYVLAGALCQRTADGTMRVTAGSTMNGHRPGIVMQLRSCGAVALDQFVMFVVDARKPFSSPASFD